MRTVMGNEIPADKQEEIREIIKCIEDTKMNNCIEMAILFGSYTRGQGVDHIYKDKLGTTYEYKSDFDILIIMSNEKKAHKSAIKNVIKRSIKENDKIKTRVSMIFHGIEHVNEQIKNRSYFFLDIYQDGIMLYNTNQEILEEPVEEGELPKDVRLAKASFYYEKWFRSSDDFLFGFETYYKVRNFNLAVFNLHQTAEHLYMGILLIFTDYKPKSHDLIKLNEMIIGHDSRFEEVFPCRTGEEERLFKKLNEAYIDSRYNDEFTINEGELTYMVGRVRMLQKLGWEICGEWINTYSKSVENMSEELETRVKYLTSSEIEDVNEIRKMYREVERRKLAEARAEGDKAGYDRGIEDGEESGRKKEKLDIARKLLKTKVSVRNIAVITGLTEDEVLAIKEVNIKMNS